MLALHEYPVEIWMLADWRLENDPTAQKLAAEYPAIVFVPCVPRLRLYDYTDFHRPLDAYAAPDDPAPGFDQKVKLLVAALADRLAGIDCVLCHDLLFQGWYLPHGVAVRTLAALSPAVRWFHWQHSGPSPVPEPMPEFPHRSRFYPMANSRFVYLNEDPEERARVAASRQLPENRLAFVPNSRDILEYLDVPARAKQFVRDHDLLAAELLLVLPARLDDGKQPKKALMVTQALRETGVDARLVWCAAYAPLRDAKHKTYLGELLAFADQWGMAPGSYHFTNLVPEWTEYCPREVVRSFQQLADVFLLPSLSEAHSLVAAEAALCRNVLVLNDDFPAMRSWFPAGSTRGMRFSSRLQQTTYHRPGQPEGASRAHERQYYRERAFLLLQDLADAPGWRAFSFMKRERNLQAVFKNHLERLLWSC